MNHDTTKKITVHLPQRIYHLLRDQAYRQGISLPEYIQRKIELKPLSPAGGVGPSRTLADLPLREILEQTTPSGIDPDTRLDFFDGS